MARLVGIDLPREKRIDVGLTYIYGIGMSRATEILTKAKVPVNTKVKDVSEEEVVSIRNILSEYVLEGDLRKEVSLNINRLKDIGSYKGQRHRKNLPVRGQRSKTNGLSPLDGRHRHNSPGIRHGGISCVYFLKLGRHTHLQEKVEIVIAGASIRTDPNWNTSFY